MVGCDLLYKYLIRLSSDCVSVGHREVCDKRMASFEEYMSMKADVLGSIHNLYISNLMRMIAELFMFISLMVAVMAFI